MQCIWLDCCTSCMTSGDFVHYFNFRAWLVLQFNNNSAHSKKYHDYFFLLSLCLCVYIQHFSYWNLSHENYLIEMRSSRNIKNNKDMICFQNGCVPCAWHDKFASVLFCASHLFWWWMYPLLSINGLNSYTKYNNIFSKASWDFMHTVQISHKFWISENGYWYYSISNKCFSYAVFIPVMISETFISIIPNLA